MYISHEGEGVGGRECALNHEEYMGGIIINMETLPFCLKCMDHCCNHDELLLGLAVRLQGCMCILHCRKYAHISSVSYYSCTCDPPSTRWTDLPDRHVATYLAIIIIILQQLPAGIDIYNFFLGVEGRTHL